LKPKFTFIENCHGIEDKNICEILFDSTDSQKAVQAKEILPKVIANELTAQQREVISLYYGERLNMSEIAENFGVSVNAVSEILKCAKKTIFRFLRYCFKE